MTVLVPAAGPLLPPGAAPAASGPDRAEDADAGAGTEQPGQRWVGAPHSTPIDPASAGPMPMPMPHERSRPALPLPYPDVTPASPAGLPASAAAYRPADPLFGPSGAEYGPAAVPGTPFHPAAAPAGPELPPLPSSANPAAPWQVPGGSPAASGVAYPPRPAAEETAPAHREEASRFDVTRPGAALMPAQPPQIPDPPGTGLFPRPGDGALTGDGAATRDVPRRDDVAGFGDGVMTDRAATDRGQEGAGRLDEAGGQNEAGGGRARPTGAWRLS